MHPGVSCRARSSIRCSTARVRVLVLHERGAGWYATRYVASWCAFLVVRLSLLCCLSQLLRYERAQAQRTGAER